MTGTLYIVATPIGNLSDLTPRAAETFAQADFIAAEDTRVTLKLLNHLGLKKPMVSYYEHNLAERGEEILARIEAGESCAMCSDAGMPAISDPGELLVRDAHRRGIRVVPVPAASASVTALAVSGLPTGRFVFEGFLPMNRRTRAKHLEELKGEARTVIFYEAPHKLRATLDDLAGAFGDERALTVCREPDEAARGDLARHDRRGPRALRRRAAARRVRARDGGAEPPAEPELTLEEAAAKARQWADEGEPLAAAAKRAAAGTPFSKSEVYKAALEL